MWLDRLQELKKETKMTTREVAEKSNLPERTVKRVFAGETDSPYADTLHRIVSAMGGSLDDILADTKVVVGNHTLASLQESVDKLTAERDMLAVELSLLKDKYTTLTAEVNLLNLKLAHKDEIIALHNYYNKLNK